MARSMARVSRKSFHGALFDGVKIATVLATPWKVRKVSSMRSSWIAKMVFGSGSVIESTCFCSKAIRYALGSWKVCTQTQPSSSGRFGSPQKSGFLIAEMPSPGSQRVRMLGPVPITFSALTSVYWSSVPPTSSGWLIRLNSLAKPWMKVASGSTRLRVTLMSPWSIESTPPQ